MLYGWTPPDYSWWLGEPQVRTKAKFHWWTLLALVVGIIWVRTSRQASAVVQPVFVRHEPTGVVRRFNVVEKLGAAV